MSLESDYREIVKPYQDMINQLQEMKTKECRRFLTERLRPYLGRKCFNKRCKCWGELSLGELDNSEEFPFSLDFHDYLDENGSFVPPYVADYIHIGGFSGAVETFLEGIEFEGDK